MRGFAAPKQCSACARSLGAEQLDTERVARGEDVTAAPPVEIAKWWR